MSLIIENAWIVTFDEDRRVFPGGHIVCGDDGRIAALGDGPAAKDAAGERVDAEGRVLLPGLINAHTHLYSSLARGFAPAGPTTSFVEILENLWWPLDRALTLEDVRASAEVGLIGALRCGVTCVLDHHASEGAIEGSLDAVAEAADAIGPRIATCFETTDRHGPEVTRLGIEENLRFFDQCAAAPAGLPRRAAMFGLHASSSLSDASLRACREAVGDRALPFHVHVAEDRSDVEDAMKKSGLGPARRLLDAGLLTPGSIAAHCIHVDEGERRGLAEAGVFIVHNPSSNMNNAVGRSDLAALLAAGNTVALGSDGMNTDILRELTCAFLLFRHGEGRPDVGGGEAEALFVKGNRAVADALFPGARLGRLEAGGAADFALLDAAPFTPLTGANALFHLIYGDLGGRVRDVAVGGRWRLRGGALVGFDEARAMARARERAAALWARCRG